MRIFSLITAVILAAGAAWAADGPPVDPVKPGDLLIVSEMSLGPGGQPLRMPLRVQADGSIRVPHTGPVPVGGLSLRSAEQAVDKQFVNQAILREAHSAIDRVEAGDRASIALGPIQAGNVLRLWIPDLGEAASGGLIWIVHVSGAGEIGLPYLGQFKVEGMSETEADEAIEKAYVRAAVLQQPIVSILRLAHEADADKLPPPIATAHTHG